MPEWRMVAVFFYKVLRDTLLLLFVCRLNSHPETHSTRILFPFRQSAEAKAPIYIFSFQAIQMLNAYSYTNGAIQNCCHFSVVLVILKLRELPTL